MATVVKQNLYDTIVSAMTTELNSLANNARNISSALGSDATTAASLYADFELSWTQGVAPTAGTGFDLYLVRSADGTNYADGSSSIAPSLNSYVGTFWVRAVTTAQRDVIPDVRLPPGLFKTILVNNGTGQSMAASGNTLKYRPHNLQNV